MRIVKERKCNKTEWLPGTHIYGEIENNGLLRGALKVFELVTFPVIVSNSGPLILNEDKERARNKMLISLL